MICGKPSHIRKWFGPCVLSYGHGGSCEHPPLEALHESDGRCSKCGNDREAWDRAIAEIARLTAELAAARAVPADVEAALCDSSCWICDREDPIRGANLERVKAAIARAISDATVARGTVGGLCGECGGECGGEGVILGGDDGHGNQEEWPCRSCTRVPLPKGG